MDFQALIISLMKKGWTQEQIGLECGCSQTNIARLLKMPDAEPKYSTGVMLVKLDRYKSRDNYRKAKR